MTGVLFTVGVGPGDPELMTLKAARIIAAAPVVASFARRGRPGHAAGIADAHVALAAERLRFEYPYTTEVAVDDPAYHAGLEAFYDDVAQLLATRLDAGHDVALLCEGDPFFYGSSMVIHDRLAARYRHEIVPGVTGMSGGWSRAARPMLHGDDVLSVLPGTLPEATLTARLQASDAAVIMKLGRNLPKVRLALERAGLVQRALYVERGTMDGERILPLAARDDAPAPYFSLVLVPGRQRER